MAINETAKSTVILDSKQADESLKKLQVESKELRQEMEKLRKANDLAGYEKLRKEADANTKAQKALKQELFSLEKVLNNLSGSSLNQLKSAQRTITAELNKMTRGTQEYIEKSKQLRQVTSEIGKVRTEMNGAAGAQQGFFNKMSNGFNKYFGIITAFAATFTGVVFGVRKAIDAFNQFEKSISNLSALTGLEGDNLKWLGEQAKLLSTTTLENGVKITASATDIVEAFKLMGSAKPELLKDKEALYEVTKQALILKEAASMETAPAITALANIMNQFSADASQAGKFINVLAAGAKEGAAEVDDLADSIIRSGAAATQANITIEQEVGLIETLAEKGIKAERAGTGLRGTILKLQKGSDEFNPKIQGMSKALENLAAKNLSAKEMIDLFGEENYTVAQTLVTSRKRFDELTLAVTNTKVATEQATKNTNNNAAALEQAKNRANLMAMTLGEKLAPALTFSTNSFSYLIKVMLAIINLFEKHGKTILSVTIGIAAYTVALKAQEMWTWAVEKATKAAEFAMSLFNKAAKANWIAIIIGLLASAASAFILFRKEVEVATQAQEDFNKAVKEGNEILANSKSIEERYKVIGNLNKRQVQQLKDDIKTQLLAEEDYNTKLLTILKKRLDEDEKIKELSALKERQKGNAILQANTIRLIQIREQELAADLQLEANKHAKSKNLLTQYLKDVESILKNMPSEADPLAGASDEDIKKMLEGLENAYQKRRLRIMQQRANDKMTEEQYQAKLLAEEIAYLDIKYNALKNAGQSTVEIQQQIAEKQIQLQNKVTEAQDKANKEKEKSDKEYFDSELERLKNEEEAIWNQVLEQEKADEYAHQQKAQYYENLKGITDNLGAAMGETIVNMATNAEMTSQDFAKAMILIAIDALHATVRMAIAEIWAKQIASKGFVGIGTSIVLSALVEAAFAGVKAGITNAGKTKQRASGKYDVIGEEDGRSYSAAWGGPMQTGIYTQPTLVAERGNELVVDAGTLRNLQVNFPAVIPTIRAAMVPQRASGNVNSLADSSSLLSQQNSIAGLASVVKMLAITVNSLQKKPLSAKISYTNVKDSLAKGQEAEDMGSKG